MRQLIPIRIEARAIAKTLTEIRERARRAGIACPMVYFEASGSIYVLDLDHPAMQSADATISRRQDAVIASAFLDVPYDVGAW